MKPNIDEPPGSTALRTTQKATVKSNFKKSNLPNQSHFHNYFSREINFLLLSILLFAVALGINLVTFPTILTERGVSSSLIGIAFTAEILGSILMSFFLGKFVSKFDAMKSLRFAAFGYAAATTLIYFYQSFFLWIVFAIFMGHCWFTFVIIRQSWLNILLSNEKRGVALGIFSLAISTGLALGPVIVRFSGASSYFSFLISASLVIASLLCLRPLRHSARPQIESKRIPLKDFFKKNPRCFLARFFLDFQTYLLLTFTVVFGRMIGLSYEAAGLLISAFTASGFFDVYVGFLLKKTSPYRLINIGFFVCMYSFVFIILYHESYALLLLSYFIFGFGIACIYVSVFKITNEDYAKENLVAANSTFQIIGSLGSLCGSFFGGYLVGIFGDQGFPIAMVLSCSAYLAFVTFRNKTLNQA